MKFTRCFLLVTVIIWVGYDVWVYFARGVNETISVHVHDIAKMYPILPFLAGVLCGHFFAPLVVEKKSE